MVQTLETLHSLGVDTVKVSLVWQLIAPNSGSTQRPANFDATNPAAYPPGAWGRWDTLVGVAHQLGMSVYFLVIGPAPLWAVPAGNRTSGQGPAVGWMPNPGDYQNFVEAAGRRYSGTYVDPAQASSAAAGSENPGLTVPGSKLLVFAQQGGTPAAGGQAVSLPTNVLTQIGLPAASALPPVLTLETPATPVEVVKLPFYKRST